MLKKSMTKVASSGWLRKVEIHRRTKKRERDAWENVGLSDTFCKGVIIFAQCRPWKSILVTSRQTGAVDSPSKSPSSFRSWDLFSLLARIRNEIKILKETETSRSSSTVSSHSMLRGKKHRVRSPSGIRKIKKTRDWRLGSRDLVDRSIRTNRTFQTFYENKGTQRKRKFLGRVNLKLWIKSLVLF